MCKMMWLFSFICCSHRVSSILNKLYIILEIWWYNLFLKVPYWCLPRWFRAECCYRVPLYKIFYEFQNMSDYRPLGSCNIVEFHCFGLNLDSIHCKRQNPNIPIEIPDCSFPSVLWAVLSQTYSYSVAAIWRQKEEVAFIFLSDNSQFCHPCFFARYMFL